jgi:hypothetical protein
MTTNTPKVERGMIFFVLFDLEKTGKQTQEHNLGINHALAFLDEEEK